MSAKSLSYVWLFVTSWTVARQAPLSMGFPRQEYCSGLPFSPPGDLPNPGLEPRTPVPPTSQEDSLSRSPREAPRICYDVVISTSKFWWTIDTDTFVSSSWHVSIAACPPSEQLGSGTSLITMAVETRVLWASTRCMLGQKLAYMTPAHKLWQDPITWPYQPQATTVSCKLCSTIRWWWWVLKYLLVYFWLFWVFVATHRLSPVLASGGCSLVAVHGLLIVVVSLVVWYEGSRDTGLVVPQHVGSSWTRDQR